MGTIQMIRQLFNLDYRRSEKTSDQSNKSIRNKLGQYLLGLLWIISAVLSFVLLVLWITITVIWPIDDSKRLSQTIAINNRIIEINYPKRLLVDNETIPVYFTIDQGKPLTLSIGLSNSDAAIVTTGIPTTTAKLVEGPNGYIDIVWTDTRSSVADLNVSPDRIPETFHAIGQSRTVTLFLKDILSETKQEGFFYSVQLFVKLPNTPETFNNDISIELETPLRASFRSFTEKYYFIAAFPFLLPLLGELWKRFASRRHDRMLAEAQKELESYQKVLASLDSEKVQEAYKKLSKYLTNYFTLEEQKRLENINDLCKQDTKGIEPETHFQEWSDMWAYALIIARKTLTQPETTAPETQSKTREIEEAKLIEYTRIFPTDKLSNEAYRHFMEYYNIIIITPPDICTWPEPSVSHFSNDDSSQNNSLFSSDRADDLDEQWALFNPDRKLFWPGHPLYQEILTTNKSFFIRGQEGCGKTTLALALTRLPNPKAPTGNSYNNAILTSYHSHSPSLEDIQQNLGYQVLNSISHNSTLLVNLIRRERDLLSRVLLSIFDDQYILSFLEKKRKELVGKPDLQEIVIRETVLLWQSVKDMANREPLLINQWFVSLVHCMKSLKFSGIRIVLDLEADDWRSWREKYLVNFQSIFAVENIYSPSFVQLIIFTSDQDDSQKNYGFQLEQLTWIQPAAQNDLQTNHLYAMVTHRLEQSGKMVDPEVLKGLVETTPYGNPRKFYNKWKTFEATTPEQARPSCDTLQSASGEEQES